MQPMTSMTMAPSGMSCQKGPKKHCGESKGKNDCSKGNGTGTANGNGNGDAAASSYLQQLQASIQKGQLPSVNALAANFPIPLGTPQGQQLLTRTTQLLSQAGPQGVENAKQLSATLNQRLLGNSTANLELALSNMKPDSVEAQQLRNRISAIKAIQQQQGQQTNPTLLTDRSSGGLQSIQGSGDIQQLTQAIYAVFSQLFQVLKSQGYVQQA